MSAHGWDYSLALFTADGAPVGRAGIDVDMEPLCQWARHEALCAGASAAAVRAETAPAWHPKGAPYVGGIDVRLMAGGIILVERRLDTGYFRPYAQAAAARCVDAGTLAKGEKVLFVVMAAVGHDVRRSRLGISVVDTTPMPSVEHAPLAPLLREAEPVGAAADDAVPLVVAPRVIADAVRLAREAAPHETGGGLVGRLCRDDARHVVFVTVTRQVVAEHTEASASHLLFSAETWRALHASLADGESLVGWWHSHPETTCPKAFFSEHDAALHRTVFPAAHQVALVVDIDGDEPRPVTAFGWRLGLLGRRGYYVAAGPA